MTAGDSVSAAPPSPDLRRAMRRQMFLAQDGVVLCATLRALDELQLLEPSLAREQTLAELYPGLTERGFGALRIALHGLHACGWLAEPPTLDPATTVPRWTAQGRLAARRRRDYIELGEFLIRLPSAGAGAWTRPWHEDETGRFGRLAQRAGRRWALEPDVPPALAELIRSQLDSGLVVPAILTLHETGRLGESGPELTDLAAGQSIAALFATLAWIDADSGAWTDLGRQARAFALNFGGVATYLPLLARLADLYRGELTVEAGEDEWHVNRELNLRISSSAHGRYFTDSEPIFTEIFNREPLDSQPRFIADTGCGEASWLIQIHELIANRTLRGSVLDRQPLVLVGVDPDRGARERAAASFRAAGIEGLAIPGDVTDPEGLAATLAAHGLAIEDGLHIRSFIDHERTYLGGAEEDEVPGWASGAYIDAAGAPLSAEQVERDQIAHMRRWAPYVCKHGMVVLEAHCVAPAIVARHQGSLHGIAFDAHQAYSKQSPVDHPVFLRCCHEAGLRTVGAFERRYPAGNPFVSISLNRIAPSGEGALPAAPARPIAPARSDWSPGPEIGLEDGEALHRILFHRGDIRFPAAWGSMPTGFVVAGALEAIESRVAAGSGGTIRVLDYGAGTGTATIELLQACRERGLDRRLARDGGSLEIHLVDLPSSWFAYGFELLSGCGWVRFHSLRGREGGFRPLRDVLGDAPFDATMANMVFHLIPPRALQQVGEELAGILAPGAPLTWSAPDLGPPGESAVLLHEPNRRLRECWLELLEGRRSPPELADDALAGRLAAALRRALDLSPEERRAASARADKRILPRPLAADAIAALRHSFDGEVRTGGYEMRGDEVLAGLLVPSNQAEYLPEIPDRAPREDLIRALMTSVVLPEMRAGPAATGLGLNLHWVLGEFRAQPR